MDSALSRFVTYFFTRLPWGHLGCALTRDSALFTKPLGCLTFGSEGRRSSPPPASLSKRRHNLFREQTHGAQNLVVLQIAEPEIGVEVIDLHRVAQPFQLGDARFRRAHDEVILQQVIRIRLILPRDRNRSALFHALQPLTQA